MGMSHSQIAKVTAALGTTYDELAADLAAETIRTGGVMTWEQAQELAEVGDVQVGDTVAVYAHQRYRVARVWNVTPTKLSAVYVSPTDARTVGKSHPNNVTVRRVDAGLVKRAQGATPAAVEPAPVAAVAPTAGGGSGRSVLDVVDTAGALPFAPEDFGHLF